LWRAPPRCRLDDAAVRTGAGEARQIDARLLRHAPRQGAGENAVARRVTVAARGCPLRCRCGGGLLGWFAPARPPPGAGGGWGGGLAAGAAAAGFASALGAGGGAGFALSSADLSSPSSSKSAIGWFTFTPSAPSGTRILPSVPSSTASNSIV